MAALYLFQKYLTFIRECVHSFRHCWLVFETYRKRSVVRTGCFPFYQLAYSFLCQQSVSNLMTTIQMNWANLLSLSSGETGVLLRVGTISYLKIGVAVLLQLLINSHITECRYISSDSGQLLGFPPCLLQSPDRREILCLKKGSWGGKFCYLRCSIILKC
jgi:hypothetical protein